jgi:hypothetical protein
MKVSADCVYTVFPLAISLVVVNGGHDKDDWKLLHELLPEVQGEFTVSVRDNREKASVKSEYLIQKSLGSLYCVNLYDVREQV